jgi:3-oxoacyl-[acyl-carrier-protein] synthase II
LSRSAVWITGLGMMSPLGGDVETSVRRLWAGERGIRELSLFQLPGARSRYAAEVVGLVDQGVAARTDAIAIQAAREALASAGLANGEGVDLVVGGTTAGMFETEELLTQLGHTDLTGEMEVRLRTHPLSSTADRLHEKLGPFVQTRTVCCACTSGAAALALGASWIRAGRSERVLAGGADALCRLTYSGFGSLAVLDAAPCRPFDKTRAGLTLGEGAGFLVLERADLAKARGVRPIAELAGYALGGEAHHITNPEPSGKTAQRIMSRALAVAQVAPADVGYVNAHGTATPLNDSSEAAAIRACFGDVRVPVSSSKGQIGHTLGAAGAIEAVIAAKTVETRTLPPTVGLVEPDAACDVDHVLQARPVDAPLTVMSSSFGFGGTGGAVVVRPAVSAERDALAPVEAVVTGVAVVARGRLLEGPADVAALLAPVRGNGHDAGSSDDPTAWLDAGRARRMDRAGRLSAAVIGAALRDADRATAPLPREGVGAISGTAFGNVDGSMRYMKRVIDKGAAFASPADFPNLVPSSPVSHAAIYWGLGGPALATPDLSATAESATATGLELVVGGVCDAAVVGSVEEISQLAERVLAPLLDVRTLAAHSEGASALVIERGADAAARGRTPLARVTFWQSVRGLAADGVSAAAGVPPPRQGSKVVAEPAVQTDKLLTGSAWSGVERLTTASIAGDHVGLGGVALAAAAGLVAHGGASSVLVLGEAPERSYAFLLEPVSAAPLEGE